MGYRMNGFSGFGNSPAKAKIKEDKFDVDKTVDESSRVYVSDTNKSGGLVSEDELESKFSKKGNDPKNYPQLSVQDYSEVREDEKGRKYVEPK